MYRYTTKKTVKANRKFAQKQSQKKKSTTKNSRNQRQSDFLAKKTRSVTKKTSKTNKKNSPKTKIKKNSGWGQWWRSLFIVVILLYFSLWLLVKFFLPQTFSLEQDKSILLLSGSPDQITERIYLLQASPLNERVALFALDPQAQVSISGNQEPLPLGEIAYRLSLQADQPAAILTHYNFSLKQALDEVYFVADLGEIDSLRELRTNIWQTLQKKNINNRSLLWRLYFFLHREIVFSASQLKIKDISLGLEATFLAKDKIYKCPVVLINTTSLNGLAAKMTKIVEMSGLVVVNQESSQENLDMSTIYYDENEAECLILTERLRKILPVESEFIPDMGQQGAASRAKAVIKLGKDLAN